MAIQRQRVLLLVAGSLCLAGCVLVSESEPDRELDGSAENELLLGGFSYSGPLLAFAGNELMLMTASGSSMTDGRIVVFPFSEPERGCVITGAHDARATIGGEERAAFLVFRATEHPVRRNLEVYNPLCKPIAYANDVDYGSMVRVYVDDAPIGLLIRRGHKSWCSSTSSAGEQPCSRPTSTSRPRRRL